MRTIVLILAGLGLGLWSLVAWAAYGLLGFAGGLAESSAIFIPLPPELVFWVAGLMSGAGGVFVWIVWGIGAAIIVAVTMIILALLKRAEPRAVQASYGYAAGPIGPASPRSPADSRSAEEIVARALGKPAQR